MNNIIQQEQLIELLINNELQIKDLYLIYANQYSELKQFWTKIANEEIGHANWIRFLKTKIDSGEASIEPAQFNIVEIKSHYEYVRKEIEIANKIKINLAGALFTALKIEKSIIEHNFFEVYKGATVEVNRLLNKLRKATEEHIRSIEAKWRSEKSRYKDNGSSW